MTKAQKITHLREKLGYFDNYIEPAFLEKRFPGKQRKLLTATTATWIFIFIWSVGIAFVLWEAGHAL